MIIGNGIDIIEIKRIEAALKRQPQLLFRVFTNSEIAYFNIRNNNTATIAGCFAAKEATVKSVGRGYIRDVKLNWDEDGKPTVKMTGFDDVTFVISITHTRNYAIASVISMRE